MPDLILKIDGTLAETYLQLAYDRRPGASLLRQAINSALENAINSCSPNDQETRNVLLKILNELEELRKQFNNIGESDNTKKRHPMGKKPEEVHHELPDYIIEAVNECLKLYYSKSYYDNDNDNTFTLDDEILKEIIFAKYCQETGNPSGMEEFPVISELKDKIAEYFSGLGWDTLVYSDEISFKKKAKRNNQSAS